MSARRSWQGHGVISADTKPSFVAELLCLLTQKRPSIELPGETDSETQWGMAECAWDGRRLTTGQH